MNGEAPLSLWGMLARVWQRPRPLILRYLATALLAWPLALLMALAMLPWFRVPLMRQALDERSLDLLMEVISQPASSGLRGLAMLGGALGIAAAWMLARLFWLLLEGGTLATYCAPGQLSWRAFWAACRHWFWTLIAVDLLCGAPALAIAGVTGAGGWLAGRFWGPLGWMVGVGGGALAGLLLLLAELTGAIAVSREQEALRAVRDAVLTLVRRPLPYLGLALGTLACAGLLVLANALLSRWIPIAWALPALLVQQVLLVGRQAVRLGRQAGLVGLVSY